MSTTASSQPRAIHGHGSTAGTTAPEPASTSGGASVPSASTSGGASVPSASTSGASTSGASVPSATGVGTAHGKVILIGEHAVVHGQPAIALPVTAVNARVELRHFAQPHIDSELYVGLAELAPNDVAPVRAAIAAVCERLGYNIHEVGVTIRSTIPVARGLGSSAAVAAAIINAAGAASGHEFTPAERFELIQSSERIAHGTPSGLDAHTVVSDVPLLFHRGEVTRLRVGTPVGIVIADTGRPSSTADALGRVREALAASPETTASILTRLGTLTETARDALAAADTPALGAAMTAAHEALQNLHVSCAELDALVAAALRGGALGAKLTGGGLGGCIVAVARTPGATGDLAARLTQAGAARVWCMTLEAL